MYVPVLFGFSTLFILHMWRLLVISGYFSLAHFQLWFISIHIGTPPLLQIATRDTSFCPIYVFFFLLPPKFMCSAFNLWKWVHWFGCQSGNAKKKLLEITFSSIVKFWKLKTTKNVFSAWSMTFCVFVSTQAIIKRP